MIWQNIRACLFDMDGTLLDSTKCFDRVWGDWAESNGLNYSKLAPQMHGPRAVDIIRRILPTCSDPDSEAKTIAERELTDLADITAVAGAREFLGKLPERQWAVVTSAPRQLACARLEAAGLPIPAALVAAEDVAEGKPSPAGYQFAASRLGCEPQECVVFEDSLVGCEAASASGARYIVVAATHGENQATAWRRAHPSIRRYDELDMSSAAHRLVLRWRARCAAA